MHLIVIEPEQMAEAARQRLIPGCGAASAAARDRKGG
jgi:hypothetical protein